MCVKLANLPSKNTHHDQIDRPHRRCANDNIAASTGDQDTNQYAGGLQDHLLLGNVISPLLVRGSHAAVAGVWSTNSYLKYEFVPADGISGTPGVSYPKMAGNPPLLAPHHRPPAYIYGFSGGEKTFSFFPVTTEQNIARVNLFRTPSVSSHLMATVTLLNISSIYLL